MINTNSNGTHVIASSGKNRGEIFSLQYIAILDLLRMRTGLSTELATS